MSVRRLLKMVILFLQKNEENSLPLKDFKTDYLHYFKAVASQKWLYRLCFISKGPIYI